MYSLTSPYLLISGTVALINFFTLLLNPTGTTLILLELQKIKKHYDLVMTYKLSDIRMILLHYYYELCPLLKTLL